MHDLSTEGAILHLDVFVLSCPEEEKFLEEGEIEGDNRPDGEHVVHLPTEPALMLARQRIPPHLLTVLHVGVLFAHICVYVMPDDMLVVPRERAREYRKEVAEVMVDSPIGAEREVTGVVKCVDAENPVGQRKQHHRPPGSGQKNGSSARTMIAITDN